MVNSGRGPAHRKIEEMAEVVREIKENVPINICCSLGLMNQEKAGILKQAGVQRINHNLNTSRRFYGEICTTHSYDDRVETVVNVRAAGLSPCCGGIIGMGETDDDIIDLALSLRGLDVASIPVNFLHPISGTPLERRRQLTPERCLKVLCLFRFVNPATELQVAGGRELNLGDMQPFALYPPNSLSL